MAKKVANPFALATSVGSVLPRAMLLLITTTFLSRVLLQIDTDAISEVWPLYTRNASCPLQSGSKRACVVAVEQNDVLTPWIGHVVQYP